MKKSLVMFLASVFVSLASTAAMAQQACFYEHAGFGGRAFCLGDRQGIANLSRYAGWNDVISSISIPNGFVVRACSDANFSGECRTLSFDQYNLQNNGFNDRISSVQVHYNGGYNPPPPPPPPGPVYGQVCLYKDAYYSNQQICFGEGSQIANLTNYGFNDVTSSIRVPWGFGVQVCEHEYFGGRCEVFYGDVDNFANFGFNDAVTAVYVFRR